MINYAINDVRKNDIIDRVCEYLGLDKPRLSSECIHENIKEICVARLCMAMGINCCYNYANSFFEFFSIITGEAVCHALKLNFHIAKDSIRLVRYENINFVQYVIDLFDTEDVDEAIIDSFNFARKYHNVLKSIVY